MAEESVVKDSLTTAADSKACRSKLYSLDAILAVGCRVRTPRGAQFRRWATSTLTEHLVKGFVMDDGRLKDPAWDRLDELLERIRGIRASEARLDRKLRELLALSEDHDPDSSDARALCATIQNRMLCAATRPEPPRPRQSPSVSDPSWRFLSFSINFAKRIDSEKRRSSHNLPLRSVTNANTRKESVEFFEMTASIRIRTHDECGYITIVMNYTEVVVDKDLFHSSCYEPVAR